MVEFVGHSLSICGYGWMANFELVEHEDGNTQGFSSIYTMFKYIIYLGQKLEISQIIQKLWEKQRCYHQLIVGVFSRA